MELKTRLDFLIEEFFNTGKLNLNGKDDGITFDQLELLSEQEEEAAEVTFSDIQDAVDSLNISTPTTKQLNFLERDLNPQEQKDIPYSDITDEDIIEYFIENNIYIKLKTQENKEEAILKIKDALQEENIKEYINNLKDFFRARGIVDNNFFKKFQEVEKEFCAMLPTIKENISITNIDEDIKKVFDYCSEEEKQYPHDLTEQYEERKRIKREIKEKEVLEMFKKAKQLQKKGVYGKSLTLFTKLLDLYNNLSDISKENIITHITQESIIKKIDNLKTLSNIIPGSPSTTLVPPEVEPEVEIDAEEEETEIEVDSEREETTPQFQTGRLLDLIKENIKKENIKYGEWEMIDLEIVRDNINIHLKRAAEKTNLEKLLNTLGADEIELKLSDISEKTINNIKDNYKKTLSKNIAQEKQRINTNVIRTGRARISSEGTVKKLIDKAFQIINNIIVLMEEEKIYKSNYHLKKYYRSLANIIPTYTNRYGTLKDIEQDLYEIIFDLNELYTLLLVNPQKFDKKKKEWITSLHSGEYEKIREVFNAVRNNNNKDYEYSFENTCEGGEKYFTETSGGDNSTIFDKDRLPDPFRSRSAWNQYLLSFTEQEEIDTEDIINTFWEMKQQGVDKYDLKTEVPVTLTSLTGGEDLKIPRGKKIEVKKIKYQTRAGAYRDYTLSEFLSPYKNKDLPPENSREFQNYETVINGLLEKIHDEEEGEISFGQQIINGMKHEETGTYGIFYEDYIFVPMEFIDIRWSSEGHGKGSESRISLRMEIQRDAPIYVWREGNPNCNSNFRFKDCDTDPGCPPLTNESTNHLDDYISEALGI